MITVVVKFFYRGVVMKLSYDPKYNVAYIRFQDGPEVSTIKISDDMNIDIHPKN